MDHFEQQLFDHYTMKNLGELRYFLGIRVIRDRQARTIYLCLDIYLEKVAITYGLHDLPRPPRIPLPIAILKPYQGQATPTAIHLYQRKIGHLQYAATMIRADLAFPATKLAQFMTNPSEEHMQAADQAIRYSYNTRFYAAQYGSN